MLPRDPRRGDLDRVPGEVRISSGCLHLRVAQQLADHREALAQGQRSGSIRVPQGLDAHSVERRTLRWLWKIGQVAKVYSIA